MKLKASHWWLTDGTIVIEVRDHDKLQDMKNPVWNTYAGHASYKRTPQTDMVVSRMTVPKGTPKDEVKLTKKALIVAHEIKVNEVPR